MTCIIIEDQAPAQRILQKYIRDIGTLVLKDTFMDPIQALEYLKTESVDLIFLDVHLPKISGMDFMRALRHRPAIILTTAFSDYAVQSYEFDVVDYLVKPFSFERFVKAVSKVTSNGEVTREGSSTAEEDLVIKSGHEFIRINSSEILYIQSGMDYTEIYLEGKKHLTSETLQYWAQKLDESRFIRVHKSFIVNLSKILKVTGNQIHLPNGARVPVGRAYKDTFLSRFLK